MNCMPDRDLYLTEKIKNVAFNLRFKLLAYFEQYQKNAYLKQGDEIYILGNSFYPQEDKLKQISEQIYQIFLQTPWFTYRSGFPQLPNQLEGSYVSDTGWGCMVRVGQMLFAAIIKQHRTQKNDNVEILKLFNDFDKKSPLSIQNISKLALIYYNLKPGEWYNPSQISNVLASLFEKQCSKAERLNFLIFNSGSIFFDQVVQKMFNLNIPSKGECKCLKNKQVLVCQQCFSKYQNYGLTVIVLSRIGIDRPEPKYLTVLQKLMTMRQFRGVIGGKPKKALYFLGRHNQDYIYLDPHYVQTANKKIQDIQDSYICESFRKCKNTSIDASLGICFYLKDLASLNNFYDEMKKVKESDPENMFIFASDKTPSYMKKERSENFELDSDDQKFQQL